MNIIFFTHPTFSNHQSMPRYACMLEEGMNDRGHNVEIWTAKARFVKFTKFDSLRKWMGYIDQFIIFPFEVKRRLKKHDKNTLFVFTDHALGPWVPMVADRKHIIHCHDFLAQQSALGLIPENLTGWSGQQYQKYIRRGYSKGKNFICISKKTQDNLHEFLGRVPDISEVVYNGLNQSFHPENAEVVRILLFNQLGISTTLGYLLHVGGNLFYKNRKGVIEIFNQWREKTNFKLPLLMIGETPTPELIAIRSHSHYEKDIYFLDQIDDQVLKMAYQGATVFLFPSLAEGFGWPIAEAMASGCPVITTNEAPMSEVAGEAAILIARRPLKQDDALLWAKEAAIMVERVVTLTELERKQMVNNGLENAKRFDTTNVLDQIEKIYKL